MRKAIYQGILNQASFGYAYHKIILDEQGNPVDYKFLDVNPKFEEITGLDKEAIINKRATNVVPGLREGNFDQVEVYGKIALGGQRRNFVQYFENLGKSCKVEAYSPEKYYFTTLYKRCREQSRVLTKIASDYVNRKQNIDFQNITETILYLAGAKFVVLNLLEKQQNRGSIYAISGQKDEMDSLGSVFGYGYLGKKWGLNENQIFWSTDKQIVSYDKIDDFADSIFSREIISQFKNNFPSGKITVVNIYQNGRIAGNIVILMPKNKEIENLDIVENQADLLGLYLEKRAAKDRLSRSQNRYRQLFEHIHSGVAIYEPIQDGKDFIIKDINKTGAKIDDIEREQVKGKSILDVFPGIQEFGLFDVLQRVYKTGEPETHPITHYKDDRIQGWRKNYVYKLSSGEIVAVYDDITRKKKIQQALKRNREKYRTVFENTGTATFIIEKDTTISMVNSRFEELSGYSRDEIEGKKSWTEFVVEEDEEWMLSYHQNRRQGEGKASNEYECRFIDRSGKVHNTYVVVEMIPNTQKSVASFIDISEQRKAEEEREKMRKQLMQSQKMESVGELAGGIAHDFNNIISVIKGLSQLILDQTEQSNPNYANLESILHSAERASDLTRQLLLFSRKKEMDFEKINLNETISRMRKILDRLVDENIKMHNKLESDIWSVKADESQIEQIIINLVINARDAMPEGGDLTIATENVIVGEEKEQTFPDLQSGKYVCLSVEDSGKGIENEIQDKIFDPFFTTKTSNQRSGMGLSVIHGIVKKHDGSINLYSEPGEGTIFKIYFPALKGKQGKYQTEKSRKIEEYRGKSENILIVEDEASFLDYLVQILGNYGYDYYTARSGAEAKQIFQKEKKNIDLLLSDVILPDSNGIELADDLKNKKNDLKVILNSGYSDTRVKRRKIEDRGFCFIQKPYGAKKILELIRNVIEDN